MPGDRFWLSLHLILALIGVVEWFSAGVARAMAGLQQSLLDVVAGARSEEIAARIANSVAGQLGSSIGASLIVATLLAVATYSGVEILRPRTVAGWAETTRACFLCAAVSLVLGILAARWIVSRVPNPTGSLFANVLGFVISGGLGMVAVLAVAAIAGFMSFEPLGFVRWLLVLVVLACSAVWPWAFVAQSLFELAPEPVAAAEYWRGVQRWSRRTLALSGMLGIALLVIGMLTRTTVSWVDQIVLAGVLLPFLAALFMFLGGVIALFLGSAFVRSVQSAEHVLRVLVQKKVNVGFTLLSIELFIKEVWTLLAGAPSA